MTQFKIFMRSGIIHMVNAKGEMATMSPLKFLDANYFHAVVNNNPVKTKWLVFNDIMIDRIQSHLDFQELE